MLLGLLFRAAQQHKTQHMRENHPYEPFPVADIEAAVDSTQFLGHEKSLRLFGESHRFRQAADMNTSIFCVRLM